MADPGETQTLRYARDRCGEEHFGLPPDHPLYECCDQCNYDRHRCHFCGGDISHDLKAVHPECAEDAEFGSRPESGQTRTGELPPPDDWQPDNDPQPPGKTVD